MLRDTSFANRINQCDVAVQNIQELAPNIPGGEAHLAEIRLQVDALRTSQESIQMLRGKVTDLVILRQQQNKKAGAAFRLLAAAARSHYGFANPLLESFNVRSEHRAKRGRKKKEVKPTPEV
jgi:hypothetical protein